MFRWVLDRPLFFYTNILFVSARCTHTTPKQLKTNSNTYSATNRIFSQLEVQKQLSGFGGAHIVSELIDKNESFTFLVPLLLPTIPLQAPVPRRACVLEPLADAMGCFEARFAEAVVARIAH